MKKVEPAQIATLIANIGVIGGILLLAFELRQNNELMAAEARATYASMDQAGWGFIIENPDFVEILVKDRNGEPTTEAEELRLNALWMQNLAQHQFRYLEDPESAMNWVPGQRRNFNSYPSLRSAWQGTGSSRQAGKDNFDSRFVQFYDENVATSH